MGEFDDYQEKCDKIRKENDELLELFEKDLEGLKPATIRRHLSNVDFYINDFLLYEDANDFTNGIWMIDEFLGGFFIRKCMWSTPGNIKSTAASIKKFYHCMMNHGRIEKADYEELCDTIKDNMEDWQYTCALYNDPEEVNPFMFF